MRRLRLRAGYDLPLRRLQGLRRRDAPSLRDGAVVRINVARAVLGHQLVAAAHLLDGPHEPPRGGPGVRNDRAPQMRGAPLPRPRAPSWGGPPALAHRP